VDLEGRLQLYAKQFQSIYVLTDAVMRASGVEEIYDKAIYAIQLAHDVDRASLLLLDADGMMRFKAWRGLSDEYRAAVEGHSPWSRDEREPQPIVVSDMETEPGYEELRPLILAERIRALAFVPLVHQERLLGKFMLYYNEVHTFSEDEIRLSQTIASHIAFAIERMRTQDALRGAEERYRSIFENAVFGAFQTTPDGRFITANDALAKILGYESSQELVGDVTDIPHQIHVDPERRAEFARILEESGVVHNFEAQAFRKDSTIIWLSLSGRALRDEAGRLAGYEGIVEDVSARKQAEVELREHRARLAAAYNQAAVGISEVDLEGRFIAANDRFCEITGYSREELLKRRFQDITHPDDIAEDAELFKRLKAGKIDTYRLEKRYIHANGSIICVELNVSLVRDEAGRPSYRIGVAQDITARKRAEAEATAAQKRLSFLAEASAMLSSSLEYEETLDKVARLAVREMGDLCSIDVVQDGLVRRVALAHVDPRKEKLFAGMDPVYRPDPEGLHPVLRVTKTGRSELVNDVSKTSLEAAARDEAHLEALRALGVQSAMVVPLIGGPRALGALTMASAESGRRYNELDLALAEELARRAAAAIEQARLFRDTEKAREEAEQAAGRTARLQEITTALSEALTPRQVGETVVSSALTAMNARSGIIALLTPEDKLELIAMKGESKEFVESWEGFAAQVPPPILEAIRVGQPFFAQTKGELVSAYPPLAGLAIVPDRSFACIPLTLEGRVTGAMVLTFQSPHDFSGEDRDFIVAFAGQCAQALERARLYEAEREARAQAETARDAAKRAERNQTFLAEASAILASSLDHQTTLNSVAKLCVPALADWCVIDTRDEEGSFQRVAVVHEDEKKVELARRMGERYPPDYETGIVSQVVRTGESLFFPDIPEDVLVGSARDKAHLGFIKGLALESGIIVPLAARGRTLGILTLLTAESKRRYGERELELAEDLGHRVALALDSARLFSAEQASRSEAEAAQQRLWFLAEANAVLSSSLDFETTLTRVSTLPVPWLADCCVAHVFPGDGMEARSALSHIDPAKEDLVRELHAHYVPSPGEPHPLIQMIETQASVLVEDIDEEQLESIAKDAGHREVLVKLGFKSYMAVPLIARGRLFGALTLARADPERRFGQQGVAMAEELARRAALALDNARLYEEAQNIQEALRVALEAKDEFLGVMSHELRTPITAIYGGTRVLRSRAERLDDESKARLLEDIEQESERLFRMVENLLVLSRLELGQEVATEPVLAQRVVGKLASTFQQRRPGRPLKVRADELMEPVAAEPHYLEQVLRNLLTNADKYSPPESPIEIAIRQRDGEADISVLDRGSGIAPEEAERIFERFYRSDRTAMQAAGIGLGLTVCKRLIEAQAGSIWARPRKGGGLEVGVTLPLYKEAPA
jgi:PAS domain S-box-containing protein